MSLPVYNHLTFTPQNIDDLEKYLRTDLNGRHPVSIDLLGLDVDIQRETIGLIENYFESHNLSFRFPYPVYLISVHEPSISQMPIIAHHDELPRFFVQKDSRLNVKEGHVSSRNRLLQQEIRNSDSALHTSELEAYARSHRQIYALESERLFLKDLLSRLVRGGRRG